ncbi:hypothetical protein F66182_9834 [Fusarium sp. NRRL 66182]|nr:hypothetical protein F66182_9834 [Fusarium sp. NRRL 66182]
MGGEAHTREASYRSACTECARRKQKCNREWPCNGCQKRKVADKCRFKDTGQPVIEKATSDRLRKHRPINKASPNSMESESEDVGSDGINAMGYMPSHAFCGPTSKYEVRAPLPNISILHLTNILASRPFKSHHKNSLKTPELFRSSSELFRSSLPDLILVGIVTTIIELHSLIAASDILVQNFLSNVNFHYYIVYPPSFLEQYQSWWTARAENQSLSVQWTCLLLTVCACASQYTEVDLQRKLEAGLGDTIQRITEQYHEAARELGSAVPLGHNHIINVQQLLHSCYWFKSEARFVECWHVLNTAIREAQKLFIHQESKTKLVSEFDLEMRRRVWCILDTWDWQISTLLGRPLIIDRADCDVSLPDLGLEGFQYSPLTHMKMQSSLIRQISARFGPAKGIVAPTDVQEYQGIIGAWIKTFPPPFNVHAPDRSLDTSYPWIVLHRHLIRTVAFSMLLLPIRAFLTRPFDIRSLDTELKIRSDGVDYCLELMASLRGFFDHLYPRDAKFHFVLFCIFDTSTVLCSAILHDAHHTLPRRDDILTAIDGAHSMLQSLRMVTKSAKASYGILTRIVQRLPRTAMPSNAANKSPAAQRDWVVQAVPSPQTVSPESVQCQQSSPPITNHSPYNTPITLPNTGAPSPVYSLAGLPNMSGSYAAPGAYAAPPPCNEWPPQMYIQNPSTFMTNEFPAQGPVFANISDQELGELANLWNYQSLDFSFIDT